jgi:hypothetical protein
MPHETSNAATKGPDRPTADSIANPTMPHANSNAATKGRLRWRSA